MRSLSIFVIFTLYAASVSSFADGSEDDGVLTQSEVEGLVEMLASTNTPPDLPDDPRRDIVIPTTYRRNEQKAIYGRQDRLIQQGARAFPALVRQFDDGRYCVTEMSPTGVWKNRSVGDICEDIVLCQVDICRGLMRKGKGGRIPSYRRVINDYEDGVAKWVSRRKGKSLAALQLEVAQWAIVVESQRAFRDSAEENMIMAPLNKLQVQLEKGEALIVRTRRPENHW